MLEVMDSQQDIFVRLISYEINDISGPLDAVIIVMHAFVIVG
jgi:hypothetical protein